jgi:hypothetical protein
MFWHLTGKTSCKFKGLFRKSPMWTYKQGTFNHQTWITFFACGQINELCVLIGCRWGQPLLQSDSQYPEASHSKASVVSAFVNQPHIPKLVNWCTTWSNLSQQFLPELWNSLDDFQPNLKLQKPTADHGSLKPDSWIVDWTKSPWKKVQRLLFHKWFTIFHEKVVSYPVRCQIFWVAIHLPLIFCTNILANPIVHREKLLSWKNWHSLCCICAHTINVGI